MIDVGHDRIASVELLGAVAFALVVALPGKRAVRDDAMAQMQAVILFVEDYGRTRTVRLPTPITIGRSPHATLVVSDAQVSRLHAQIDYSDGQLCVRDLDSRNGTLLNARPIDVVTALRTGDVIDVGTTRVRFDGVGAWK